MLNRHWRFVKIAERVGDAVIITLSFILAYYGRASVIYWNEKLSLGLRFGGDVVAPLSQYLFLLVVALPLFLFLFTAAGTYDRFKVISSWKLLGISLLSSVLVFFALAALLYTFKIDLSRLVVGLFCLLSGLSVTAERYVVKWLLSHWLGSGRNSRNILIMGAGAQGKELAKAISKQKELGISLVGFADYKKGKSEGGKEVIASGAEELENALKRHAVDEVIFTDVRNHLDEVEEMLILCSEEGVYTTIAADLFSVGMARSEVSYFGKIPLVHYQTPPGDRWDLVLKRLIDFVGSALLLIVLSPLFLAIAIGIRIMSPGPIIFKQKRVGLNGRLFWMYKFRSMKVGAEEELKELIEKNEMDGPVFKMKDDPRVTPFGKFLRRFSLDELPQLYNVLKGDMSLVGPRPPVPSEVGHYVRRYKRRLSMRPGLTCIWQVSGRNEIKDFDSWVRLDMEYIDNWSLALDFRILLRTIPAVLMGYGAR
ncbi:MAG: sugar transferase [Candidatus Dadabacteria bacterium]|nr:MAG: sugar transferase [Candidatus Dadabacteria bacterium]